MKNECISEKDYSQATNVRNTFENNTVGDYHDLYVKTDILLLADLFEKFINICLEYYGFDPCHYFSSPGLSWDAMLKMTGRELNLSQTLTCICLLKKEREEVFRTLLKDIVKQIINTCNHFVLTYQVNLLHILIQTIYMVGQ